MLRVLVSGNKERMGIVRRVLERYCHTQYAEFCKYLLCDYQLGLNWVVFDTAGHVETVRYPKQTPAFTAVGLLIR